MLVSPTGQFKQSLDRVYITDSHLSVNDFRQKEVPVSPTGQFKQSLDGFYATDSPLRAANIAQIAMFYLN